MNLNHNNNHLHYPYTRLIQRFPNGEEPSMAAVKPVTPPSEIAGIVQGRDRGGVNSFAVSFGAKKVMEDE